MNDMNDDTKVNGRRIRLLAVLMCLENLTVFIAIALLMIMPLFITVIRLSFSMMVIQLISIIVIIMLALYALAVFIHTMLMRNNTTVNDANTGNDDTYSEDNTDYSSMILNNITNEM